MTNEQMLGILTDRFDICFEDAIISKEQIVKKYADFIASTLSGDGHSVSVALHTGSVCFEIVSLVTAVLMCVLLDKTDTKSIIGSLKEGDIVLFKNKRYRWHGLSFKNGTEFMILEQDGCGKNGPITWGFPFDKNKNLIKPYRGTSRVTDGRGIRGKNNNRADFISHLSGVALNEVPSFTRVSIVIVKERDSFNRLSRGLRIIYGEGKSIGLLDIVSASYYTDSGEKYQYGNNPAKTEPVLKVTGKVSTARDLVLEKHGNEVVGLIVAETDAIAKGSFELTDLSGRKSLRFIHVEAEIDSSCAEDIIEMQEEAELFACTREFLQENSLPPQEKNFLTLELHRQVKNIINNTVTTEIIEGGCSWEVLNKTRETLYTIRNSEWDDDEKNTFLIEAYSLFNLFITAVFPIKTLEKAVESGKLMAGVASPALRIQKLRDLSDRADTLGPCCNYVTDVLESLYKACFSYCSKYDALKAHLDSSNGKKIAVVVPKAYYIGIICADETINKNNITIITANRFDNSVSYSKIIAVGDFRGKRFDSLKCRASAEITVLLYECEIPPFKRKKRKAEILEKWLNYKNYDTPDDISNFEDFADDNADLKEIEELTKAELDLEQYLDNISTFDIRKYVAGVSGSAENVPASEVCAIGRFVSGEQILFSKYYNAVVLNSERETVYEIAAEDLSVGDQLVFAKRDDYTRNMVDYIYENLQAVGRLSAYVLEATGKATYWKKVLREYKDSYNLTYRDIAKELQKLGSSLQEVSVRQWLMDESHIVGPRDESSLQQIAELTQNSHLLGDVHSYFEACRVVRRQRKEILDLIGKAIKDKMSGHKPPAGSVLEVVYDNVESLSETLELDAVTLLEEPISAPINLINKPIHSQEISI